MANNFKFCSLHQTSNAGFGPLITNPETCMTISCPNPTKTPMDEYFQQSQWGSNINNSCMKPLADAQVSKQYRCDERWYDWFTVPNYHLGNGYTNPDPNNPGVCYNPCPAGSVPAYQTDPIDGQNLRFTGNEDNTGNCISRANYFTGKYASGSDYCPLSWIYILNSTPNSLQDLVKTYNNTFENSDMASNVITKAFSTNKANTSVYANNIYNILPTELNNINTPSDSMQNACNRIETESRVLNAYQMCSNVMINEQDIYNRFAKSLPENLAKNKVTMMKQACNAVFCNLRDPAPQTINKNPLCFKNVGTFNPSTGEVINPDEVPYPAPPEPIPQKSYMYNSIKTAIYLVLFPLLIYLIYVFFTDAVYPYVLMPIYLKIMVLLGKYPETYPPIYTKLRDLNNKLTRAKKNCNSAEATFFKNNETLKQLGKPLLNKPDGGFSSCKEVNNILQELDSVAPPESSAGPALGGPAAAISSLGGPGAKGKPGAAGLPSLPGKGGPAPAKGGPAAKGAPAGKAPPKAPAAPKK